MSESHSVAMTAELHSHATQHLLRADRQEDACFALWKPSRGATRFSALPSRLILPLEGETIVYGNVEITPEYLERALTLARKEGCGLALMHSHPFGHGWQGMSQDDIDTEKKMAGAVFGATGLPLLGMTMAGDENVSGRFWIRSAPRTYERNDCSTVRVVGNGLRVSFNEALMPATSASEMLRRTVAAWGERAHADLSRMRVGIIGNGSVGGMVGEAAARTGIEHVTLIDFDKIETHNLDRLVYATRGDVGGYKSAVLAERLRDVTTSTNFRVHDLSVPVYREDGFRAALDCDVLFCCVDRPRARFILNLIAFTHLIPVVDGGIAVRSNRHSEITAADWKALTAMPGNQCLRCARQYDPGAVQLEIDGTLDDLRYIENLRRDHPLRMSENVFGFTMGCATLQFLQFLTMVLRPLGLGTTDTQIYHFIGGYMEEQAKEHCHDDCEFPASSGDGDTLGLQDFAIVKIEAKA